MDALQLDRQRPIVEINPVYLKSDAIHFTPCAIVVVYSPSECFLPCTYPNQSLESSTPKKERQHSLQNETVILDKRTSRTDLLEHRIKTVETANQVLQEELASLQDELQAFRKQTLNCRRDHENLLDIVDHIKASNNMISKMVTHLREAENMLYNQKLAFNAVLDRTSHFDMILYDHQEDMKIQKRNYQQSITELWNEVRDVQRQRGLTDKTLLNLLKEARRARDKEKQQDSEINLIESQLSTVHRPPEIKQVEWSTAPMKPASENRPSELEDHLPYIRNNFAALDSEKRTLEQNMIERFNELNIALARQDHKREEELNKLYRQQQEINHLAETEHINLQSKIAQAAEDAKKTLNEKEIQLREEAQQKFFELEESIQRINTTRIEFEKKLWQENENKWASFQHFNERVKDHPQTEGIKEVDGNKKVDDDMLAKHKWLEKVLTAEILKRDDQGMQLSRKFDDLHGNMTSSVTALQKTIGYLQETFSNEIQTIEAVNSLDQRKDIKLGTVTTALLDFH
eukprot:gi/632952739/ref/XP_007892016.1/ PREDICTED: eukaryotic translation initiation factor 3 subunit A-like [Callorhinchus milii]